MFALTPPPFPFLFLPSAINRIQDYYYLILSLLYTNPYCSSVNQKLLSRLAHLAFISIKIFFYMIELVVVLSISEILLAFSFQGCVQSAQEKHF
jgi:hypothetical protein